MTEGALARGVDRSAGSVVFAIALVARLSVPFFGGGLGGDYRYDAPTYYSAGMGLVHGQLPYRDFVLVHPPLIAAATAPFAALGELTSDHVGFVVANLAFTVLGAFNAVLVLWLARSFGLTRTAAVAGALFYAVWFGSIGSEFQIRLEPLGNTMFLLGLLALLSGLRRLDGQRLVLLAGVLLGLAVNVKIWWAVPAIVVVGWACTHGRRRGAALVAGGVAVVALLDLPMLLLTRGNMWAMVVTAQLERSHGSNSLLQRLWSLDGAGSSSNHPDAVFLGAGLLVVVAGLCCAAPLHRVGRFALVLLTAQLLVMGLGPTWYYYYPDYFAVVLSLVVAGGTAALQARPVLRSLALPLVAVVAVSAVVLSLARLTHGELVKPAPDQAALTSAVAGSPCVLSSAPMLLVETDSLGSSFDHGCRDWVDVAGMGGYTDTLGSELVDPAIRPGLANYLTSADAAVVLDLQNPLMTHELVGQLRQHDPVARIGHYLVSAD